MITLKKEQVAFIEKDIQRRGVVYKPLQEDILDHLCSAVEFEMEQGTKFMDAYQKVMKEFGGQEIEKTNQKTIRNLNPFFMFKNYVKVALRNLARRKVYTAVNIGGLAIGIAAFLFIIQFIRFEKSYDDYHENAENIYRIRVDVEKQGSKPASYAVAFAAVAPTLLADFPEVVRTTRMNKLSAVGVFSSPSEQDNTIKFKENQVYFADSSFLQMFSHPVLSGNIKAMLSRPNTCVLTKRTAEKYFGDADPMGKFLLKNGREEFEVTGIVEDVPENSHLKFDMLLSYSTFLANTAREDGTSAADDSWGWWDFYTYIQLAPSADFTSFQDKIPAFVKQYRGDFDERRNVHTTFMLQPIRDIHLNSNVGYEHEPNGDNTTVNAMSVIAIFILVIAWVNYINLSTSRAMDRAKEVGVRKVIGSYRSQLIRQFLTESFLINCSAALLALVIIYLAKPYFNALTGRNFEFDIFTDAVFLSIFLAIMLLGTLLSGLYPAFVLSAFKPVVVLKGKMSTSSSSKLLRQGLVIFQFMASIALIVGTFTVYKQTNFMIDQELGVDIDQTLIIYGPMVRDSTFHSRLDGYKDALLANHSVQQFGTSSDVPGKEVEWGTGFWFNGKTAAESAAVRMLGIDEQFIPNYDLEIVAGRNFSSNSSDSFRSTVMVNEQVIQQINPDLKPNDVVGKILVNESDTLEIVGVVKDYYHRSLKVKTDPVMYRYHGAWTGYFTVKMNLGDKPFENTQEVLALAETKWHETFPENPFSYFFLDNFYNQQYQTEVKFGKVFSTFSLMAIIVACLGLFALSSFTVLQRHKEIGVRKVLGASVGQVLLLLSKDFIKLVFIGGFLATPLAYYFINQWLMDFPKHITISVWIFLFPVGIVMLVALITVSYQTVKAALSNPVKTLRYE